jgi:hypothetical protein
VALGDKLDVGLRESDAPKDSVLEVVLEPDTVPVTDAVGVCVGDSGAEFVAEGEEPTERLAVGDGVRVGVPVPVSVPVRVALGVEEGVWEGLPLLDLELDPVLELEAPGLSEEVGLEVKVPLRVGVEVGVGGGVAVGEGVTSPVPVPL